MITFINYPENKFALLNNYEKMELSDTNWSNFNELKAHRIMYWNKYSLSRFKEEYPIFFSALSKLGLCDQLEK
jgi:hypothetical protein